jgi:DNA-binding NarL/FixJ family response regulator
MPLKILLADDHQILRDGLRALLEREEGLEVVGEADDGRKAVRLARDRCPDVVVIDVGMPELNGIEATRQILAERPGTQVVALSVHSDRKSIVGMLRAGARSYLLKDSAFDELVRAIRAAGRGEAYLGSNVADVVVSDYLERLARDDNLESPTLTSREKEVLQLLAEGKSNREAAAALNLSVKTVESHRSQVMRKLGLKTIAELTRYAIREGLCHLEG